jgi:hypothetical protein
VVGEDAPPAAPFDQEIEEPRQAAIAQLDGGLALVFHTA